MKKNTIKIFHQEKSFDCKSDINLSELMRTGAEKFDGVGGGHDAAAGAKITKDKLDGFLNYLEINVVNMSSAGSFSITYQKKKAENCQKSIGTR